MDLHPPRSTGESRALDVSDGQQVGYASFNKGGYEIHAGLWSGTARSWVDLHPTGAEYSTAYGVSHGYQAGIARLSDGLNHAGMWSGTRESWVDLHALLPADYLSSCANDIQVTDTDIWVVGEADGRAVLWHKRLSQ